MGNSGYIQQLDMAENYQSVIFICIYICIYIICVCRQTLHIAPIVVCFSIC